jgi:hypothetical protein
MLIFKVSGSTSTSFTVNPAIRGAHTCVGQVTTGTRTSFRSEAGPAFAPRIARHARRSADEPEFTITVSPLPRNSARDLSKWEVFSHMEVRNAHIESKASAISSTPYVARLRGYQ